MCVFTAHIHFKSGEYGSVKFSRRVAIFRWAGVAAVYLRALAQHDIRKGLRVLGKGNRKRANPKEPT